MPQNRQAEERSELHHEKLVNNETTVPNYFKRPCSLYQKVLTEQSMCFLLPLKRCLDEKGFAFVHEFLSISIQNCGGDMVNPKPLKGHPVSSKNITMEIPTDLKDNMLTIIFDRTCSYKDRIESVKEIMACAHQHFNFLWQFLNASLPESHSTENKFVSTCKIIEKVLDYCFQSNFCYTEFEMTLIKESISKIYIVYMESLLQFSQAHRNFHGALQDNFRDVLINTTNDIEFHAQEEYKKEKERYMELINMAMEDYKKVSCQSKLKSFSLFNSSSSYLSQKWFTIPVIALSIIFTCYLLVQCRKASQT